MGFSTIWILNACNYELRHRREASRIADLLGMADRLVTAGPGTYTFLVPLDHRSRIDSKSNNVYLSKSNFAAIWQQLFPELPVPANTGGLRLDVSCLDKHSAVTQAAEDLAAAELRVAVASNTRQLIHSGEAWMSPGNDKKVLSSAARFDLKLPALDVKGGLQLFDQLPHGLESSLELILGLGAASSRTALISAWAALESLLADASDFGSLSDIATRAADTLACEFVVVELASLATAHARDGQDALATELREAGKAARVLKVAQHIGAGGGLTVSPSHGAMTFERMKHIIRDPKSLCSIRDDIEAALKRLYRTRNQISHSGGQLPESHEAILQTSRLLLGALFNRFILAARSGEGPPGIVAARSTWLMMQVERGAPLTLVCEVAGR